MEAPRYLCSQLVTLSWRDGGSVVNLEEIGADGAVLESEEDVPVGSTVEIRCGSVFFAGKITRLDPHEFGVRIEIEFSPLTPWTLDRFRPEHLLYLAEIEETAQEYPNDPASGSP